MEGNTTQTEEFILLGFSYHQQTKIALFVILLLIYMVNLIANSLFITVTVVDARLHLPMYFFLCNLSLLDICITSVSAPTVLKGLLAQKITVTVSQCITQLYIGLSLGQTECFLLTVMAWDRYVAISKPLNYQQIMTNVVCVRVAIATWVTGFTFSSSSVIITSVVHFCGSNVIDHTVCEADALSRLTCMNRNSNAFINLILAFFSLVIPVFLILYTYCRIIFTILRMPTAEGRHRTFATCGSHLVVVTLFYGTAIVVYFVPKSTASSQKDKSLSVFYELVVPALNPLIYTLRNKEVKGAVKKLYNMNTSCQQFRT